MKHLKLFVSLFTFILILSCPLVNAEEIKLCEMSDEYREWLNTEDKDSVLEPQYCKESNDDVYLITNTVESLFDITSSASDIYYNAVNDGIVTDIKNQWSNNACWAFTSVSLLETQAIKNNLLTKNQADFSESHIVYNTSRYAFYDVSLKTYNRTLSSGGSPSTASSYFYKTDGPIYEDDFPYSDEYEYIEKSFVDNYVGDPILDVDSFIFEMHKWENDKCVDYIPIIKQKVAQYGSVGVNLTFKEQYLKTDGTNFYYFYDDVSLLANHSVTIVGWDDTIPASKFQNSKVTSNGAWIVKNSWGTGFGNNGYFYVSYYDPIPCREIYNFTSNRLYDYDNNYASSEAYGNVIFTLENNSPVYVTSKFESSKEERLRKVSFQISDSTSYTVYVSPNNNLNDFSSWIEVGSGTTDYKGIKSVYFDDIIVNGQFAIIVKFQSTNENATNFYGMCSSSSDASFYYNMDIDSGKNYYFGTITNNMAVGLTDFASKYNSNGEETLGGCESVIYAYTSDNNVIPTNPNYTVNGNTINVYLGDKLELGRQDFLNGLTIDGNYKIYDSKGNDVTSSATFIGTNYRLVVNNTDTYYVIVFGDVSGDGKIQSNDATFISRHIAGLTTPSLNENAKKAADVSKDSIIKSNDATIILRFLARVRVFL